MCFSITIGVGDVLELQIVVGSGVVLQSLGPALRHCVGCTGSEVRNAYKESKNAKGKAIHRLPIDASILRKMPVTGFKLLTFHKWYNTCEVELDLMAGWKGQRPLFKHSESTCIPMRSFPLTWISKFSVIAIVPYVSLLTCL